MLIKLHGLNMTIIQDYALTTNWEVNEVDNLYDQIQFEKSRT